MSSPFGEIEATIQTKAAPSKHVNYELLALAKLVKEYDKELLLDLHPEYFSAINRNIYKLIMQHFSDNQKLPTMAVLKALVASKAPKDQLVVVNGIISSLERLEVHHIDNFELTRGLKDKHLMTALDANIQQLATKAMQKDLDGVRVVLSELVESTNLSRVKPSVLAEVIDGKDDNSTIIPTGFNGLDEYIQGYSGLSLLGASSGAGKSSFLIETAIKAYQSGYNVLFVSLELSPKVLGMRIKSNLTGIDFARIVKHGTVDRKTGIVAETLTKEEQDTIAKTMAEFFDRPNHFRIVSNALDTDELLALIQVEKSLYDIDIVYLDYLNLVSAPRSAGSNDSWKNLANTAKALHRLSMTIGVVTVTATQVNLNKTPRAGSIPDLTVRGSSELLFSSTLFMYLHKPEAAEGNSVVLYVVKNRNGPTGSHLVDADFSIMSFEYIMPIE